MAFGLSAVAAGGQDLVGIEVFRDRLIKVGIIGPGPVTFDDPRHKSVLARKKIPTL